MDIKELQKKIQYEFKNEDLLVQALTHSSYANEHQMKAHSDNERLEFLGDAVLEITTSEHLYLKYPDVDEGKLTRMRASVVCELSLAYICHKLDLGKYLRLSKGEEMTGGRNRASILSDAFEAMIGAVYLDGGFDEASRVVDLMIPVDIEKVQLFHESKTRLQELVQAENRGDLSYDLIKTEGPDHNRQFTIRCIIGDKPYGEGTGQSKKEAEQRAAYHTIKMLKGE